MWSWQGVRRRRWWCATPTPTRRRRCRSHQKQSVLSARPDLPPTSTWQQQISWHQKRLEWSQLLPNHVLRSLGLGPPECSTEQHRTVGAVRGTCGAEVGSACGTLDHLVLEKKGMKFQDNEGGGRRDTHWSVLWALTTHGRDENNADHVPSDYSGLFL